MSKDDRISELERKLEDANFSLKVEKQRTEALWHTINILRDGLATVNAMLNFYKETLENLQGNGRKGKAKDGERGASEGDGG